MKRVVRSLRSLTPRGFTLPEVLVTVAIIAVLASAVVPTVVNQISKGDTPALQADLNSMRQAVVAFTADVHAYPATIESLDSSSVVTPTTSALCPSTTYGTGASSWKGPYLSTKQGLNSTTGLFKTASYNLSFANAFTIPSGSGHIAVSVLPASGTGNLTISDVAKLKLAIDGVANADTTTGYSGASGFVRYGSSGSFAGNVYILLVPIGSC